MDMLDKAIKKPVSSLGKRTRSSYRQCSSSYWDKCLFPF